MTVHPARLVPGSEPLDADVACDYMVPLTVHVNVETGAVLSVELHLESFQSSAPGWFTKDKGALPPQEGDHRITLRQAFIGEADGEYADGEHPLADAALAIADRVDVRAFISGWHSTPVPGGTIYADGHCLAITEPQARDLAAAGFISPHPGGGLGPDGSGVDGIKAGDWILGPTVTWDEVYDRLGGRP